MDIIELERWKPSEADPRKLEYAGQPTAQEVFEELKHRLEGMGYLPDEYFDLRFEWENGKKIPKDADIFCTVDYGGSEGVYVDVYLKWYDEHQKKSITSSFIVGKTLGENGNDLDRMFLTASAITKAFHGDHATHTRYMKIGGVEDDTGGRVIHLSQQEEKVIIKALVEQRERQEQAMGQTEQLLRRMTGSITAYMDTVGQRPLCLSDYDKTVLAIQDGELSAFKELYESCEKSRDMAREYHNAIFVGRDENGVPRHAHKRSINNLGKTFRINVEGSDPRCSFHYTGTSDRLYVFEAPIDLMSFLTRYPRGWQEHSFVSLCGTSEHAMLWMLEQNPGICSVCLCLDHDEAGIEASGRLAEVLHERGYDDVGILQPEYKDWNEELKARRGLPAQEAEEHPQLIAAQEVCGRIGIYMEECIIPDRLGRELADALRGYEMNNRKNHPESAMSCIELASALALFAYGRELRQLGEPRSGEELTEELRRSILPHQNRSNLKSRTAELVEQVQSVLAKVAAPGIRSEADKRELAESWLDLAVSCAKVPVKFEADMLKQQQKQEQAIPQLRMG